MVIACRFPGSPATRLGGPRTTRSIEWSRLARAQNPEIWHRAQKNGAARGGSIEARSGYLPSVVSNGLYRPAGTSDLFAIDEPPTEDYNESPGRPESLYWRCDE